MTILIASAIIPSAWFAWMLLSLVVACATVIWFTTVSDE